MDTELTQEELKELPQVPGLPPGVRFDEYKRLVIRTAVTPAEISEYYIRIFNLYVNALYIFHIEYNTSDFSDEFIGERLGFVPILLSSNKKKWRLDFEGPKVIMASDIFDDEDTIYRDLILFPLREGQRLKLDAYPVQGTQKDHARWACAFMFWEPLRLELDNNGKYPVDINIEPLGQVAAEYIAESIGLFPEGTFAQYD